MIWPPFRPEVSQTNPEFQDYIVKTKQSSSFRFAASNPSIIFQQTKSVFIFCDLYKLYFTSTPCMQQTKDVFLQFQFPFFMLTNPISAGPHPNAPCMQVCPPSVGWLLGTVKSRHRRANEKLN